ncbi:hypothetical protein [uncultured Cardiobacterium sp.]|uniref:hypothetical protein n=1 Tax=uncultured Cardiobacterium sp. TaxID=417619 RepID=UPI00262F5967|nr:hypothetical protein [uncultured Cardiobacterium sp.]
MQNTTPETSVTALLTHDKDWQNRITVPSEEYEKWMEDFRQRLSNCTPEERRALLEEQSLRAFREHMRQAFANATQGQIQAHLRFLSVRAFSAQVWAAQLAGLMPADEEEGASADADCGVDDK